MTTLHAMNSCHRNRPAWIVRGLIAFILGIASTAPAADWLDTHPHPHLEIEVPPKSVAILRGYQWKWGGNDWDRTNVSVTVREGDLIYTNVQMHLKGSAGSFRPFDDKPAMTLHFNKEAKGQKFHGMEKIHLNNSVQDPSYLHEIIAREWFNAAGVPVPKAAHATVTLNSKDRGLYVLVEGWNKSFLKRHFATAEGTLFEGGFAKDVDRLWSENQTGPKSERLEALGKLVTLAQGRDNAQRLDKLRKILDVDRFMTFAAMEILLTHVDGYCIGHNNYRLYHDPISERFVFLPHGLDQLFGTYRSTPDYSIHPPFRSLVGRAVMDSRGARSLYLTRVGQLYTNHFQGNTVVRRLDELARELRPVAAPRLPGWETAVERLKTRVSRRIASVQHQLENPRMPDTFDSQGELKLTRWTFRPDNGAPATGGRQTQDGMEVLSIQGSDRVSRTWSSWRISPFLGPGRYEFQARVCLDLTAQPPTAPGSEIAIRISGDREGYPKSLRTGWHTLSYPFELGEPTELELVCELRGIQSAAYFDLNSLKVIRKSAPPPAP